MAVRAAMVRMAALVAISLGAAAPTAAQACSYPRCLTPSIAGGASPSVPASAPAIPLFTGTAWYDGLSNHAVDGGVQLFDDGGNPVPITVEWDPRLDQEVLVRAELQAGASYLLRYEAPCGEGSEAFEGTIHISDPVATPTTVGTLSISEQSVGLVDAATSCGSCVRPIAAAFARLTILPAAELEPYLPVTRFELLADGQPWALTGYGKVAVDGTVLNTPFTTRRIDEVFAACRPSTDPSEDNGLAPGPHVLRLDAYLAGTTEPLSSQELSIDLDCSGSEAVTAPESCYATVTDAGSSADAGHAEDPPTTLPSCFGSSSVLALLAFAFAASRRL